MRQVTIDGIEFVAHRTVVNTDDNFVVLATRDAAALAALNGADEQPLIDEDGVAVSPLAQYPGEIRFPPAPTGREFKAVYRAIKPTADDLTVARARLVLPYWRAVQAVAEVEIACPDGNTVTAETDADDVPAKVLDWAARCLEEYDANFLRSGL